jgi:Zn-dependent alcohol dehydrogenase
VRLEGAKEFGAWETVNPRSNDPVGAIKDLTHGGADFTLDTSSQPEGRIAAVRSAKVWGTVCFVGERNNVTIDVSPDMLRQTADDHRLLDLFVAGSGRLRALLRQAQGRCRPPVHPQLEARLFDTQTTGKDVFLM